ncbi:MAG: DMT family transporter [Bacteroidetes bacterium]|nr:DMT family transporter [Bacteroidota bacterium]
MVILHFSFYSSCTKIRFKFFKSFRLLLALIFIGSISAILDASGFTKIFTSDYSQAWLWLGLSGIVGLTFGDYFAFEAYSILGARLGSVLTTFAPAAALCLAWILLGETLSFIGIIGISSQFSESTLSVLVKKKEIKFQQTSNLKFHWV